MRPRFFIERGSATLSAALVAGLDGRSRLIAAAAFPAAVDVEALLAYLAARAGAVADAVPELAGDPEGWRAVERIEAVSVAPRRAVVLAPTARRSSELDAAATQAGWRVSTRITPERADALATSAALAEVDLDGLVIGAGDPPRSDERKAVAELAALAAAVVARRSDLIVVLSGAAAEEAARFPLQQVVLAPAAPAPGVPGAANDLTRMLMALGEQERGARLAAARTVAALATVLERTVELVDVGTSGGAWFRAAPPRLEGEPGEGGEGGPAALAGGPWTEGLEGFLLSSGSIVPDQSTDDDADLDAVIAWSPLRLDRPTHRDRLRDLRTHPWQDAGGEGAVLRMAAGRAALARIEAERVRLGGTPAERFQAPDLLVVSGGAFAVAPGPAIALAAADTMRRVGMMQIAYDHARLLAPIGMLGDAERLSLVSDLADDILLPLGSVLMTTGGRPGREVGRLRVASEWTAIEPQALASGMLRIVELPPGASARVELEVRDGRLGRTRARRLGFEATGGLGGLVVDTRGIPLRLPQRSERRRDVLAQWQRSLWPGAD